jgi:predicted amidohydrolase
MSDVKVAAIQANLNEFPSIQKLNAAVDNLIAQAAQGGAKILVFPEDVGLWIESIPEIMSPRVSNYVKNVKTDKVQSALQSQDRTLTTNGEPCKLVSPFTDFLYRLISEGLDLIGFDTWITQRHLLTNYLDLFRHAAKKYNVVIVGGSTYELIGGKVYSVSYIFDCDGSYYGPIKKHHLVSIESGFCSVPKPPEIETVQTKDYNIGVCICFDVNFESYVQELVNQKAQIICVPSLGLRTQKNAPYNPTCDAPQLKWAKKFGISFVRTYQFGDFLPRLTGKFIPLYLDGLSSIITPDGTEVNKSYPQDRNKENILIATVPLKVYSP